eukprot:scaffold220206_cov19-Tisochrysis_lutea.AAC.1
MRARETLQLGIHACKSWSYQFLTVQVTFIWSFVLRTVESDQRHVPVDLFALRWLISACIKSGMHPIKTARFHLSQRAARSMKSSQFWHSHS